MAAFMKVQPPNSADSNMQGMDMSGMNHTSRTGALPNEVSFPYGLPIPGRYRVFFQMKHGNTVETGVFDAMAQLPK